MPLTDQQTKQLLDSAKARGLTREQARDVLVQENQKIDQSQQEQGGPNILESLARGAWDIYNLPSRMAGGQLRAATQVRKGEFEAPDLGSIPLPGGRRQELGELILPNIVGAFRGVRDKTDMFEATPEALGVEPNTAAGIALGLAGEIATPDPLDAVAGLKALKPARKSTKAINLRVPGGEGLEDVSKVARELNIDLPVSARTSNQFVKQTEAILQKGLFGNEITKKITKAFDDVAGVYDNITAKFAKEQDLDSLGKLVKENVDEFVDTFQETKRALYSNVPKTVKKVQVNPTNTLRTLDETIESGSKGLFDDSFIKKLSGVRSRLAEAANSEAGVTYEVLDETQKQIGKMVKNFADPVAVGNKGVLRRLFASTAQDLDESLKVADPVAFEAIKNADEFYREGIELINDRVTKSILRKNPTDLFKYLSKPGKEQELATLKRIMGEDDFTDFTGEILQKVFNQSTDSKGIISAKKLEKNISKYGEKSLRNLLTAEQYAKIGELRKQLSQIDEVSTALKAGTKPASGSQTAFLLQSILTTGGFLTNPLLAAQYVIGSLGATKAFQSPLMEQILTTGVKSGVDVTPALNVGRRALQGAAVAGPELLKTQFRPQQIEQSRELTPIERALEKEKQVKQERNILP